MPSLTDTMLISGSVGIHYQFCLSIHPMLKSLKSLFSPVQGGKKIYWLKASNMTLRSFGITVAFGNRLIKDMKTLSLSIKVLLYF